MILEGALVSADTTSYFSECSALKVLFLDLDFLPVLFFSLCRPLRLRIGSHYEYGVEQLFNLHVTGSIMLGLLLLGLSISIPCDGEDMTPTFSMT